MLHQPNDSGFRRVATDIVDLFELQWQLMSVDGEEAKRRAIKAGVWGGIAAVVALASTSGLIIGLGWFLHEQFGWSVGMTMLAVSAGGIALATIAGLIAIRLLGKASQSLAETKSEFAENMRWIKSVIVSPNTSPRNQIRKESFPNSRVGNGAEPAAKSTRSATNHPL